MQNFKKFLYLEKGLSKVTVQNHVGSIKRIGQLNREQARDYVFKLYQSNYSYSHKTSQVIALEYWLEHTGEPIQFARQKKPKPMIKDTLSEADITKMIMCCKNIREKTILSVLAYSGLRPKELVQLRRKDIDFGSNELRVIQGKDLKDGVIYLSNSCIKTILEYLETYNRHDDDFLFKTADELRPYNQMALRKLLRVVSARAKLNRRVYPYLFRHSLATSMIKRGADIITVKNQMRHVYLDTTMLYIHSTGYSPGTFYERFVPSYG